MAKPIIAVTPRVESNGDFAIRSFYMHCIELAGGVPILLSVTEDQQSIAEIIKRCDGVLLSGGADIHPSFYGEETLECCGKIDRERDNFEISLTNAALAENKSILGICRGMQVLNVAMGGSLYQDLPAQYISSVSHYMDKVSHDVCHSVSLSHGLEYLFAKKNIMVNSYHHQAVKTLGWGLDITAKAQDDIIEGICLPDKKFVYGVQWHPELLEDDCSYLLFRAFVQASKN